MTPSKELPVKMCEVDLRWTLLRPRVRERVRRDRRDEPGCAVGCKDSGAEDVVEEAAQVGALVVSAC